MEEALGIGFLLSCDDWCQELPSHTFIPDCSHAQTYTACLTLSTWILRCRLESALGILHTFFFGTSWCLYMFLKSALTFQILDLLPKRLSNRCLASAALMPSSFRVTRTIPGTYKPLSREAGEPNDSCVWGVAQLTIESRQWQDLIIFCSCVYIFQVCLKNQENNTIWCPKSKW